MTETGQAAADDDHRWVDEADQAGQHHTDPTAAIADELDAGGIALGGTVGDVLRDDRAVGGQPLGQSRRGADPGRCERVPAQRGPTEQGLQATDVAARAHRTV